MEEEGATSAFLNISSMPLHVGVDAWNLTGDRRGIGRYVREVVRHWAAFGADALRVSLLVPERAAWFARKRYTKELDGADLPVRHRSAARALDVVWYPWNGMSWVAGVTSVATLHDASLFTMPPSDPRKRDQEQRPFRVAAALARRIITDSHFSKQELIHHLNLDDAMIDVIHLGVKDVFNRGRASDEDSARSEPGYLLFVGEPEVRKGLATLLQALASLPEGLRSQTELIVVGSSGQYPLPPAPPSVRMRDAGWVDDEELAKLYAGATALVYPSLYEGFGLPMVEAMAMGTPVIAAGTASLREAGAGGARFVQPGDPRELRAAIEDVITHPEVARDLRRRGLARAQELSWESTAKKTLEVLERAVASVNGS
jgi:glycosyltransferase involved in cell wall biosynthesis